MYISDLQICSYTAGPTRNTRHNTLDSTRLYPLCCTCTMMDARTGVLPRRRVSVLQGITFKTDSRQFKRDRADCAWVRGGRKVRRVGRHASSQHASSSWAATVSCSLRKAVMARRASLPKFGGAACCCSWAACCWPDGRHMYSKLGGIPMLRRSSSSECSRGQLVGPCVLPSNRRDQ